MSGGLLRTEPRSGDVQGPARIAVTAVVLTFNEEANLPTCLESLAGWTSEIVIVDSGSTDRTLEIAEQFGARVLTHPFATHSSQWRWALAQLLPGADWVLALDADQAVTEPLRRELIERLPEVAHRGVAGCYVTRRQVFRGKWIRHGGYYPKHLLKLFRRDAVRIDDNDLMDHRFYVDGSVVELAGDIVEDNRKEYDIAFWIAKHNRYAVLHAQEERIRRSGAAWPIARRLFGSPDERSAWMRSVWYRLPLYVRPALYFGYRYFLRLGFLDGKQGFVFHFLQGFWYRLLIDIHLDDPGLSRRSE